MTNKELWEQISAKNPSFNSDGNVTLSSKGLRKLFDLAYDKGFDQGRDVTKKIYGALNQTQGGTGMDIFHEMFGGFGKK
jgi:hypothetical protein